MNIDLYKNLPYRPCVGVMLVNDKNKVFVGKRIDTRSDAWQMPQGGIDAGEIPVQAVFRELLEEIGTDKAEVIAESKEWYSYDLPEHLVPKLWDGQYRGQRQRWFLMRFSGQDSDINIHTEVPEFMEWKWSDIETLPDIIVPFKRELYSKVVAEFIKLI